MSGRYKILEELGAGGAGSVCKAYDTQLNRYVALKRLLTKEEEQQQDPQSSSLKNEAASLATLQHPNIVTIYDLASDETGLFIVMELLEGDTLSDWIQGSIMSLGDFYELATQTLEGVLSAHGQSILHRDLKPENMKVKRLPGGRLQVKIVDFGLARLSYGAKKQTEDHRGHILGSIFYMAPEQFLRRPLDGRTDLYSLGCVYYQALSGRRPFQAKSVSEVMDLHLKHQVILLHDLRPDLSSQLCDWVMWLMNGDPAARPANAQQALESLRGLAATGVLAEVGAASESAQAQAISGGVARPATSTLSPRTTSSHQPVRRSTSSMSARPASGSVPSRAAASSATKPLPRSPQYQGQAYPTTGRVREHNLAWLYIVIAITALAGGGVYYFKKKREASDRAAAPPNAGSTVQTAPDQAGAPGNPLLAGSIVHWLAGENMDVWSDDPASAPLPKTGDLIVRWHDLTLDKGDAILSACDRRKENCPTYLVERLGDLKDTFSMLRFDTGKCMAHRAIKEAKKNYPFGENVKDKGLTLFLIARPRIGEHEVTLTKLLSQDGKGWLRLQAFASSEFRVQAGVKQSDGKDIVKECRVKGRSTKVFSLISLRWDPPAKKITLTVRSGTDGAKTRAECDVPPDCPALTDIHVSEFSKASAKPPAPDALFTGDIHEFVLWPFVMTQDQHADEAQKLAERYFKFPGSKW